MMILGGGVEPPAASIAIAFLLGAERAAAPWGVTHVLPALLTGGAHTDDGRAETEAVFPARAAGFALGTAPNQLRAVPAGGTKAESAVVVAAAAAAAAAPSPAEAKAAVRQAPRLSSRIARLMHLVVRTRDDGIFTQ